MNRPERRRQQRLEKKQQRGSAAAASRRQSAVRSLERFSGVSVLGALARLAVPLSRPSADNQQRARVGLLSTVAAVAVRVCPEQGEAASVHQICELLPSFGDWHPVRVAQPYPHRFAALLASLASPQVQAQRNVFDAYGRTLAILTTHWRAGMPDAKAWSGHFGVSLQEFMLTAFGIGALALQSGGLVDRRSFAGEFVEPLRATTEQLWATIEEHLSATWVEQQSAASQKPVDVGYEEFAFNPVWVKPVLLGEVGAPVGLCPFPLMAFHRGTLTSLYFDGLTIAGTDFTNALGHAVEDYVETVFQNLANMTDLNCRIHREVVYGNGQNKSVDFFLEFDELVLAVEVKAYRQIEALRQGLRSGVDDMIEKISRAAEQIEISAKLIHDRHTLFEHIPADRPIRGLIVSLEPWPSIGFWAPLCVRSGRRRCRPML